MSDGLKPCPFCGGEADIRDGRYFGQYIVCLSPNCECEMGRLEDERATNGNFDGVGDAARAWNTRAKPKVKPLQWQNFDAWTYWAETPLATYRVNERGGYWRLSAQVGGEEICPDEMHGNSEVEAKSAAETYHQAMILGALE